MTDDAMPATEPLDVARRLDEAVNVAGTPDISPHIGADQPEAIRSCVAVDVQTAYTGAAARARLDRAAGRLLPRLPPTDSLPLECEAHHIPVTDEPSYRLIL